MKRVIRNNCKLMIVITRINLKITSKRKNRDKVITKITKCILIPINNYHQTLVITLKGNKIVINKINKANVKIMTAKKAIINCNRLKMRVRIIKIKMEKLVWIIRKIGKTNKNWFKKLPLKVNSNINKTQ